MLSDDGMAITWEIAGSDLGIAQRSDDGGTVTIGGIMADASAVGNGEDITAAVTVSGAAASGSPIKLADVMTGLDITVTAASGLRCEAPSATNMAVPPSSSWKVLTARSGRWRTTPRRRMSTNPRETAASC